MKLNEHPEQEPSPMFDEHGRCIPAHISSPAHGKSRRYFRLSPPQIDYAAIHARAVSHLGVAGITADEFRERGEAVLRELRNDAAVAGIANGIGVPFLLPQADHADYGFALQHKYIEAVQKAFQEKFPQYRFTNHHQGDLSGKLGIVSGSRHERLLQAMRQGAAVGWYFPCLTEYSVPAAVERLAALPEQFLLAGGFDTSAALVAAPELLQRTDGYPPLLWLAAVQAEKPLVGYYYEAYGYNLTFNRRPHFGQAAESWTSGLVVLG